GSVRRYRLFTGRLGPRVPALRLLGDLAGEPQRQRLPYRHRLLAPLHHDAAQALHQGSRGVRIDRRLALVDRSNQPSRAIGPDEPQVGQSVRSAYPSTQLGAVLPRYLLGGDPVVEQRRLDLGPGLLPDALAARCGERAQLQRAVPVHEYHLLDRTVLTSLYPD